MFFTFFCIYFTILTIFCKLFFEQFYACLLLGSVPTRKRDRPQHKKGPTPIQKGTDPNTKRDRPQHKKGPTPTQKGTDPNTKRDRPQHKKGPTPTQKGTDPNINLHSHYIISIVCIYYLPCYCS